MTLSLTTQITQLATQYGISPNWLELHPNLLAVDAVKISLPQLTAIRRIISSVEKAIKLDAYQQKVLSWAPEIAQKNPGPRGLFLGYDFHLTPQGPKLIEINHNAAGFFITSLLEQATENQHLGEQQLVELFKQEWHLGKGDLPLHTVAIVDENPTQQGFYSEFLMLQNIFETQGITAFIIDPAELQLRNQRLYYKEHAIDLVYNRLTDFNLSKQSILREAYLTNAAVITSHPYAYALYSDKRNLTLLSDSPLLASWGMTENDLMILSQGIPSTFVINPEEAATLWATRKRLFFKPIASYGGKGVYRGANITRRVFAEVIGNDEGYIAQELAPPSEQTIVVDGNPLNFKVDLRFYVYNGEIIGQVARLYRGQVTNFRTHGGGFARIVVEPFQD